MTDLSTRYLGLSLATPLVVSASPLTRDVAQIEKLQYLGAGAVVLPSLFEEQLTTEPRARATATPSEREAPGAVAELVPNAASYNLGPTGYLELIREAKAAVTIPIIASLNATTPGSWANYAREIEVAGADALELNVYDVPTSTEITGATLEQKYCDLVSLIKNNVHIPVAVKLSPFFTSLPNLAVRLEQSGADGLVLFNRFYQPDINIYSQEITPTLELSTSQELRLRLHWVAALYGQLRADLAATGGVHEAYDVVKALLAGARVVMIASALMQHGINYLESVRQDLGRWLQDNGWKSVLDIQGKLSRRAVADPTVYDRVNYMQVVTSYRPDPRGKPAGR
jgi:dihydroorotate dehydrogenase (fumarate)